MTDPDDLPGDLLPVFAVLAERFGISRPAGQILGLLYLAPEPLCADELVAALHLSRSNISTALKELRDWSLVGQVQRPDDRRSFFIAPADPWTLLHLLTSGRARWETRPALAMLQALSPSTQDDVASRKIRKLRTALASVSAMQDHLAQLSPEMFANLIESLATPKKKKKSKGK